VAKGTLLAESLRIGAALDPPSMTVTRVVRRGPFEGLSEAQPPVWTFIEFRVDDADAAGLADLLADRLDSVGGWYCDLRTDGETFVAFPGRVFRYSRGDADGRRRAADHARAIGIPESQLDWPE
jgi:hypothetical protein